MGACTRGAGERGLTERQRQFIEEYLECRQTVQAALRAGYSEKTARHSGWRLLQNPQIRREIDEKLAAARQRKAIGRESVVAELAQVAFATVEEGNAPFRMADKLRALDILAKILGLYDAKSREVAMPDLAEQLRRARLRVERMKKEDEEKERVKREEPPKVQPSPPEIAPAVEEEVVTTEPAPRLRAKDIPFSMIMGRHPESPFPLDPPSTGHTGWQNFEFDPYEY